MFGTALIVFREALEAALIIGVVGGATRGIPHRGRWLLGGGLLGLGAAGLVALGMNEIAGLAEGIGQELFNAAVLGLAVAMLAWHAIWMAGHGRNLAAEARASSQAVREGRRTLFAILLIVAIAVLREGAETVLFVYGIALSGASSVNAMLAGALLGVAAGALVGWTLYRGLLRIPLRWFFAATSALVLLLAAGMAAQAARYLIQADLLPSLKSPLWDLSGLLSNESALGTLLHGLIGYDAHPAGTQVLFYVAVAAAIGAGMKWSQSAKPGNPNKAMAS